MRLPAAVLLALIAPVVAACGGEESDGTTDVGGASAAQTAEVSASDFEFDPSDITAEAGEITFVLTNDGDSPHALEIEGNGVEEESETVDPGETTRLTVDLDEGRYEVYCPVGDHEDGGMTGTLTVGSGGGTGTDETETGETETGETETGETETGDTGETETDDSGSSGYGY